MSVSRLPFATRSRLRIASPSASLPSPLLSSSLSDPSLPSSYHLSEVNEAQTSIGPAIHSIKKVTLGSKLAHEQDVPRMRITVQTP
eukprot:761814-Hanusia_phi.AAC.2